MRALVISHQRDAGPGVFATALTDAGHEFDEWHLAETDGPPADPRDYGGVLTFGGAMHADQGSDHPWIEAELGLLADLLEAGTPLLAVCLGAQLLAVASGGSAVRVREPEIGWFDVEVTPDGADDPVTGALAPRFEAFEWHSYECRLPGDAVVLARTPVCVQAFRVGEWAWGIQFHAEVTAADARSWIDDYRSDEDAVRIGVDPDQLRAETEDKIEPFNRLGRELCGRWAAAASLQPISHPRGP
jgi:GMP synthase-like glutamine amidotransferase